MGDTCKGDNKTKTAAAHQPAALLPALTRAGARIASNEETLMANRDNSQSTINLTVRLTCYFPSNDLALKCHFFSCISHRSECAALMVQSTPIDRLHWTSDISTALSSQSQIIRGGQQPIHLSREEPFQWTVMLIPHLHPLTVA